MAAYQPSLAPMPEEGGKVRLPGSTGSSSVDTSQHNNKPVVAKFNISKLKAANM